MNTFGFSLFLFMLFFHYSSSQGQELTISPPKFGPEHEYDTIYRIYILEFSSNERIILYYYTHGIGAGYDYTAIDPQYYRVLEMTLPATNTQEIDKGIGRIKLNELIINQDSVLVDREWIRLEKAYDPITGDEIINGGEGYELFMVSLSPNRENFGGTLYYRFEDSIHRLDRPALALWNRAGKLLYQEPVDYSYHEENLEHNLGRLSFKPFEIFFSPKSSFLVQRSIDDGIFFPASEGEKSIALPGAVLLHIPTLQKWEADRDVAFSSDDRYLVTARGGKPTLVETRYNNNRLTYDMPVPMLAATFSPDDQKVYIVGEDNLIYVFPSGISSATAGWEVFE